MGRIFIVYPNAVVECADDGCGAEGCWMAERAGDYREERQKVSLSRAEEEHMSGSILQHWWSRVESGVAL